MLSHATLIRIGLATLVCSKTVANDYTGSDDYGSAYNEQFDLALDYTDIDHIEEGLDQAMGESFDVGVFDNLDNDHKIDNTESGHCEVRSQQKGGLDLEGIFNDIDSQCASATGKANVTRTLISGPVPGTSNVASVASTSIKNLQTYGCWCHFWDIFDTGRGQPQDPVDGHCKNLHLGYDCIRMDSSSEGDDCEPTAGDLEYELVLNINFMQLFDPTFLDKRTRDGSFATDCNVPKNDNNCKIRTCALEAKFIMDLLSTFLNFGYLNRALHHVYGGFDWQSECIAHPGTASKECCGMYPMRQPYNPDRRSCCEGPILAKTYNPAIHECCTTNLNPLDYHIKTKGFCDIGNGNGGGNNNGSSGKRKKRHSRNRNQKQQSR